ncbi:2-dehydropantoate 2-reductase [Aspergillus thermomutatus]|uniref:C2H2-type domain-containing protein n=1 Tax=Aspergillus thermomutatus TaxID=41047 RepID=A0A397GDE5_ASPTH|nr:uncharacterized protein CDV56_103737 [Aspergillus thermomutatus]RHZ49045.1 hypothetical protein CDV56_103737 [Aspergillus thermomutatus]
MSHNDFTEVDDADAFHNSWWRAMSRCHAPQLPTSGGRGLPRRKSQYILQCSGNQSTLPIFVPNTRAANPMERWRESPPEDEPASISAILEALNCAPGKQFNPVYSDSVNTEDADCNLRQYRAPPSTTNGESSASSRALLDSNRSRSSSREFKVRKGRTASGRARKATRRGRTQHTDHRKFCCTFCCDKFKTKYDWAQHEKSLHLNLEEWQCAPHGTSCLFGTDRKESLRLLQCAGPVTVTPESGQIVPYDGYELELYRKGNWYSVASEPEGFEEVNAEIQQLIVSVKATQTVAALRPLKHRLSRDSTILFLQNGCGMLDDLNDNLFPNPETRPSYITGVVSHGVTLTRPFCVTHTGFAAMSLGLVPHAHPRPDTSHASCNPLARIPPEHPPHLAAPQCNRLVPSP